MKKIQQNFWKYALYHSKHSSQPIILKDVFLKWAAQNSLKLAQAQDIWKQVQSAITFVDNGVLYQVDNPEEIKEIQQLTEVPDFTEEIPEESDVSETMRDAIEDKKEEKQEEAGTPHEQRTLLDTLEDDEEEAEPEVPPTVGAPELPEELPPLPAGAV